MNVMLMVDDFFLVVYYSRIYLKEFLQELYFGLFRMRFMKGR